MQNHLEIRPLVKMAAVNRSRQLSNFKRIRRKHILLYKITLSTAPLLSPPSSKLLPESVERDRAQVIRVSRGALPFSIALPPPSPLNLPHDLSHT